MVAGVHVEASAKTMLSTAAWFLPGKRRTNVRPGCDSLTGCTDAVPPGLLGGIQASSAACMMVAAHHAVRPPTGNTILQVSMIPFSFMEASRFTRILSPTLWAV
jgi:hypothetical protein